MMINMPDLNTWLQKLSGQSLPVLAATQQQLKTLMSNENLSIGVYAGPILQDPGMASILLRDVNKAKAEQGRSPIGTISNVMPHLGPARIRQHLQEAVLLEDLGLSPRHHDGYMRYLTQACHCAYQARSWSLQRQTIEPEEVELAALLQNIAELALWCFGGEAMLQIEHQLHIEKQSYEGAARHVLGCDMRELGRQLAQAWYLSELCIDGLASDCRGYTLATGVALASRLARLSAINWYGKESLEAVQAVAGYQGHSIAEVEHQLHINAVTFTECMPGLSAWAPAKLLMMEADDSYIDRQYAWMEKSDLADESPENMDANGARVKTKAGRRKALDVKALSPEQIAAAREKLRKKKQQEQAAALAAAKSGAGEDTVKTPSTGGEGRIEAAKAGEVTRDRTVENKALPDQTEDELGKQIVLLKSLIKQHDSAAHVIQQAVNTAYVLGFDRAAFIMKVPKKKEMVARFFCQNEGVHQLKPFKIMLDKPHLFSLLMGKPQNIWLNDKNRAKYWNMLPANVKLALRNDSFFTVSIFSGSKPVGLMYVDKPDGELSEVEYKKFLGLCKLLSKGLVEIVQKRSATTGSKVS